MSFSKQDAAISLLSLSAAACVCYLFSIKIIFLALAASVISLAYTLRSNEPLFKAYTWAIFLAPQAISLTYNQSAGSSSLFDISYNINQLGLPYFGVHKSLAYLDSLEQSGRASSVAGAINLSIVAIIACAPPLISWSLSPARSEASATSLYKLSITFLIAWIAIALLLLALPLHSIESCTRRCSNIAASNMPRLNIFLFAQSILFILPAIIVKCQITAKARSKEQACPI